MGYMIYIARGNLKKPIESDTPTFKTRHNDRKAFSNPFTSGVHHFYGGMP